MMMVMIAPLMNFNSNQVLRFPLFTHNVYYAIMHVDSITPFVLVASFLLAICLQFFLTYYNTKYGLTNHRSLQRLRYLLSRLLLFIGSNLSTNPIDD